MIKTLFILIIVFLIIEYVIKQLKHIKSDPKNENENNYWMLTYDFKETKKNSIFDKVSDKVINIRAKKNKLILILYLSVILGFILVNSLVAQILILILG